ncbi:HNH endonuclease [Enterococcus phage Phi_Eg_SY1]|nr:HNH endonuclease [Enterococcus phage Phi_Eg_SY1]
MDGGDLIMPLKKCEVTYCRNKVPLGTMYCDKHMKKGKSEYNKRVRYNSDNGKYSKFYHTPEWRATRKVKLLETPYCEVCMRKGITTKADMVHHIIELRDPNGGWEKRLEMNNLESICYSCHNKHSHKYAPSHPYRK